MELSVVIVAGVFGLVIGSFLNRAAARVPAHVSLMPQIRCPRCDAPATPAQNVPVLSWLVLQSRCASCHEAIPARPPITEAVTGLAFAGVAAAWLAGWSPFTLSAAEGSGAALILLAYLYFAAISIVLTLIDLDTARLPNAIVLPSYPVSILLLTAASWLTGEWPALLRAVIGMAALYTFYLLLRLVRPGSMGGGDVKLAGVVGLFLGYVGWGALAVGAFAAFLLGGIYGIALLAVRKAGRKSRIPFGPWMLGGAWIGIFTGEAVGLWYVDLYLPS